VAGPSEQEQPERHEPVLDRRFRTVLGRSGIFNARDLGGLPADGGMVRFGLLVRGDALHRARPDAAQGLADRGISLVLDLRDAAERDTTAVFSHPDVTTEHHPVLDEAWSWEDEDHDHLATLLEQRYRSILTQFGGRLARAVQRVADHDGATAFHCAVGDELELGLWSARPVTMQHTLEFLQAEFGGAAGYLAEHGAGPGTVAALRSRLVVAA